MSDLTPDEEIESRNLEQARAEQLLTNAYHRVFATEEGKKVLADLNASFGLTERVFKPVKQSQHHYAYDPLTAALRDGSRQVIIYIADRLAARVQGDGNIEKAPTKVIKI